MVDQHGQRREDLLDGSHWGWRVLVTTKVHHHPGDIPQEADGNLGVDECEKGLDDSQLYDVVPEVRSVPDDVAEGPDCLLAHVLVWGVEQLQEERDGPGVDHGLGLLAGAAGDVGEGPGGLELEGGLVRAGQTAHQHWQDAGQYQGVYRRISVRGQELPGGLHGGQLGVGVLVSGPLHDGVQAGSGQVVSVSLVVRGVLSAGDIPLLVECVISLVFPQLNCNLCSSSTHLILILAFVLYHVKPPRSIFVFAAVSHFK